MKTFVFAAAALLLVPSIASAQEAPISRRDAFLEMWTAIKRMAFEANETPYSDVPQGSLGFLEITYAKDRGLLPDQEHFYPDAPLTLDDAVLWLIRTRNIEPLDVANNTGLMDIVEPEQIPMILERFPFADYSVPSRTLTATEFRKLMNGLDEAIRTEVHNITNYSEKFHGKGTAFGETFDMYAMTAAHRTFPPNTLVKVTNAANNKSVIVRINDRGPFYAKFGIDLSKAAYETIAEPGSGVSKATIERLGDFRLVDQTVSNPCRDDTRTMRRISSKTILEQGVPHTLIFGKPLSLSGGTFFVVDSVKDPAGAMSTIEKWIEPGETYVYTPSAEGEYRITLRTPLGKKREMPMMVKACDERI